MSTNNAFDFRVELDYLVDNFGSGSQEGVKAALRICQDEFGCVSPAYQAQIADAFALSLTIVKTFMKLNKSLKETAVEYEVICCGGQRCAKNGSVAVLSAISDELGIGFNQTTADGRIHLRTQNCFKKCKDGPNIMINDQFCHHLDAAKARKQMQNLKAPISG